MRPKWLVTPRGRMASNSGCTEVLVEGAMTANFRRNPRESVMARFSGEVLGEWLPA